MAEMLSEHFSLNEFIYSDTAKAKGIDNSPTEIHKKTMKHTCQYLLEPLRKAYNDKYKTYKGKQVDHVGIRITSGYRSAKLNAAIPGASSTSSHCKGEACDIEAIAYFKDGTKAVIPYTESYEFVKQLVKVGTISVDQAISEVMNKSKWVHISHSAAGRTKDRRQFLKYNGKTYALDVDLP